MANQIVSRNGNSYELRKVSATISDKLTPIGFVPVPVIKGEMFDPSIADVLNGIGVDIELMFRKAVDGLAIYLQAAARNTLDSKEASQMTVLMAAASMTDAQLNGVKRGSPEHIALARAAIAKTPVEAPSPTKVWWELLPKLLSE